MHSFGFINEKFNENAMINNFKTPLCVRCKLSRTENHRAPEDQSHLLTKYFSRLRYRSGMVKITMKPHKHESTTKVVVVVVAEAAVAVKQ